MTNLSTSADASLDVPLSMQGPATTHVVVGFGFWLFLLSDIIIFAALFATYAVLAGATAGGPTGAELFDKPRVFAETLCLLLSSFTCGLGSTAARRGDLRATYGWFGLTAVLGIAFLYLEIAEFAALVTEGAGPTRSAFLSAFFTLVGTHGLHVAGGLVWLAIMLAQIATLGLRPMVRNRLFCFALFWHALDIVWVGVFTIVYLGASS